MVIMSHDRSVSESYDGDYIAINKINTLYTLNLYNVVWNYMPIKKTENTTWPEICRVGRH